MTPVGQSKNHIVAAVSEPLETELKLELAPSEQARLNLAGLSAVPDGRAKSLISTYYDTPDQQLRKGGYSLRIVRGMCQPYYIIDGQYQPGFELDLIPPNDIEGIELYKGSSETPPQFNRMNAVCGVIVVWTRDPEAG